MYNFITSIKTNLKGIIFVIFASICTTVGQLLWKFSNGIKIEFIVCGFIIYFLGAILIIIAFKYGSLSVIHPFMSIGYIFAMVLGKVFLNENLYFKQYFSIALIITGIMLIGGGDN